MVLIETDETNKFSFEAFASHKFYTKVNRSLVRHALTCISKHPSNNQLKIVDMACGTGAVTRLIAEELASQERQAYIIGIDPSAEALRRAQKGMEELQARGIEMKANFIQGETSDLPKFVQNADAVFFCNAIHLLPDKLPAFKLISSILAPNGIFACNSAFYNGSYVEGTERFYRLWTRRAVGWLRREHPEVRLSREVKAMAMQQLDREGYIYLLKEDRKSTRLNSSHGYISYAVFCLKKKKTTYTRIIAASALIFIPKLISQSYGYTANPRTSCQSCVAVALIVSKAVSITILSIYTL